MKNLAQTVAYKESSDVHAEKTGYHNHHDDHADNIKDTHGLLQSRAPGSNRCNSRNSLPN
jgi:hypothetical protein